MPRGILYLLSIAVLLPLIIRDQYIIHGLTIVLFYAFLAQSWNIVGGYAGQMSLGHAAYVGIGAYVSTILFTQYSITPWVGIFIGGLIAALFGVVIGYPAFRMRGPYYCLTTIAFSQIIMILVNSSEEIFGVVIRGAKGLLIPVMGNRPTVFQFSNKIYYYLIILIMLILVTAVNALIRQSKFGLYLMALRSSHSAAEASGVNVTLYKLAAAAVSSFFCGMGGAFLVQLTLYVDPATIFSIDLSVEMAILTIIGGSGTVWGPILGAVLLRPISEIIQVCLGGMYMGVHLFVYGIVLVIAILFIPQGLYGLLNDWAWLNNFITKLGLNYKIRFKKNV